MYHKTLNSCTEYTLHSVDFRQSRLDFEMIIFVVILFYFIFLGTNTRIHIHTYTLHIHILAVQKILKQCKNVMAQFYLHKKWWFLDNQFKRIPLFKRKPLKIKLVSLHLHYVYSRLFARKKAVNRCINGPLMKVEVGWINNPLYLFIILTINSFYLSKKKIEFCLLNRHCILLSCSTDQCNPLREGVKKPRLFTDMSVNGLTPPSDISEKSRCFFTPTLTLCI